MNPIHTGTIPTINPDPAIMLIQREAGGPITYASINASPEEAIDMLRRALIHIVAGIHSLATVPTSAAIATNGHASPPPSDPSNPPDPSNPSNPIPPLRVPKTKPNSATPLRGKPGPKPGARRRKVDVLDDADKDW
jgi:hypothetical protein